MGTCTPPERGCWRFTSALVSGFCGTLDFPIRDPRRRTAGRPADSDFTSCKCRLTTARAVIQPAPAHPRTAGHLPVVTRPVGSTTFGITLVPLQVVTASTARPRWRVRGVLRRPRLLTALADWRSARATPPPVQASRPTVVPTSALETHSSAAARSRCEDADAVS